MLTITVGDVMNDKVQESSWGPFCIYVFRDSDFVLYVGKTDQNIIDRIAQHLGLTYWSESQVGKLVEDNAPESYNWCVDLLTLDECVPIVKSYFPSAEMVDVALAEQALILEYSPALNSLLNPHPRALPRKYTSRKDSRIKDAYRKMFNAKQ
jgi:hypothetical protein